MSILREIASLTHSYSIMCVGIERDFVGHQVALSFPAQLADKDNCGPVRMK